MVTVCKDSVQQTNIATALQTQKIDDKVKQSFWKKGTAQPGGAPNRFCDGYRMQRHRLPQANEKSTTKAPRIRRRHEEEKFSL
jgi:hypothetical protein